ncbi:MAG: phenylalanine--tRNA ligase subunit beta [Minisyncoccus archaeiphilus]|uniref:phenylalanine--tRNA ligase subunit beta n=1 Tax=Minisyncoccus archaeiphilus TaxID=3238481 RepID=UPI0009CEF908|nr:MAG: Phenylalanine--tRNA ligase beta subunit [Parcubacteria group bacterium ADurb.Bin216]GMX59645.1 MAG: phenylalanine--tRNA ligase subunit beta [Candidatus Parcubacteria bacterium]
MIISYSWLNSFFKKPLPKPEKLAELLTLHSFENESIVEAKNDWVFSLDVLPDRAGDCLSHLGIARECFAISGLHFVNPEIRFKESLTHKIKDFLEVEIKDKDCKRYIGRVMLNVKIQSSPKWIQERLIACGLNPINNVVDATNFVMLELGQPLHVFDYDKVIGKKIVVKKAKASEEVTLLSGEDITLDKTMLTICDTEGVLAIAGVKGGKKAEIDSNTKNIIIESANFTPRLISQTARKLNIRTDASMRFEHNLDPNLAESAMDRVVTIISQSASGEVVKGCIDVYPEKVKPIRIKMDLELLNRILGVTIPKKELELIVKRLNFKLVQITAKFATIEIPTWRQDITIKENLIEEIGRIYGYNKIEPVLPCNTITPAKRNDDLFWQYRTKESLKNIGWTEVYNYSFVGDEEKEAYSLDPVQVNNPVSVFFKYIRPSLLPQLIKNCSNNLNEYKDVKIYEIAKIFMKDEKKVIEKRSFAGVMVLDGDSIQTQFLKLKGDIEYLLNDLGVTGIRYVKSKENCFFEKSNAVDIYCEEEVVGCLGQISLDITEQNRLPDGTMGFDIDFDCLQKYLSEAREYKRIATHPPANRDLSGIVKEEVMDEKILKVIEGTEKEDQMIDMEVKIIDIYRKGLSEGMKSVTVRLTLRHNEKTLNSEEIERTIKKIINNLSEEVGWEERK